VHGESVQATKLACMMSNVQHTAYVFACTYVSFLSSCYVSAVQNTKMHTTGCCVSEGPENLGDSDPVRVHSAAPVI